MNRWLLICLLLASCAVRAQTVYESFEVDTVCEPQGGQAMLQLFIQSNLSVPVNAQADRVKGRVFVSGVVEPDGKISSLSVTRGLRPDCNREALRVFTLFNAWAPARKDGQPVRQHIIYPVTFTPGSPVYVQDGNLIEYFTKAGDVVADSAATVYYRQTTPVDTLTSLPTGDRTVYERKGTKWREVARFRLKRGPTDIQNNDLTIKRTQLYFVDAQGQWSETWHMLYPDGSVAARATCENGRPINNKQEYAPNGMLEAVEHPDETPANLVDPTNRKAPQSVIVSGTRRTTWYPNGQLQQVEVRPDAVAGQPAPFPRLLSQWDSRGTALVAEGTGQAVYRWTATSRRDTSKTILVESGPVRNGLREGNWTGRYEDGSYSFRETYEGGDCRGGVSEVTGRTPITYTYTGTEQNPAPVGGMQGLSAYLGQSLRYPADAQRSRLQGKVFVSFIVNTDGFIQDVKVLKGVGRGLDEEAVRVVKNMPRWKPGMQRGEPVRVRFNLPIAFTLQ